MTGTAQKNQSDQNIRARMSAGERQRLNEKKKKRKKRRLLLVVCTIVLLVSALLAGLVYGFVTVFRITAFTVEGTTVYTAEQVFERSGLKLGKNLFISSTAEAEEQVETLLPYIGKAEIKRKMPGTLRFILTETQAAAFMQDGTEIILTDKNGKILDKKPAAGDENIPLLTCPAPIKQDLGYILEFDTPAGALENPLDTYKNLLAAIENSGMKDITLIDMANPADVWLVYQDRIKMHLGTPAQLESRLVFAVTVIDNENAISPVQRGEIDLTILKSAYFRPVTES